MIISNPSKLHGIKVDDDDIKTQGWLAIKHDWRKIAWTHQYGYHRTSGPHYSLQTLRALSHTCKCLRALTLPLLWSVVHVKTAEEMGRLRDVLRQATYLAPLIRHFSFLWDMNEEYFQFNIYPQECGSLLDIAFADRGALWEQARISEGRDEGKIEIFPEETLFAQ